MHRVGHPLYRRPQARQAYRHQQDIQNHIVPLVKADTSNQLAHIFTKALHYPQFISCLDGIQDFQAGLSHRRGLSTLEGDSRWLGGLHH